MRRFAILTTIALVALSTTLACSAGTDDKSTEPAAAPSGSVKAAKDITAEEKSRILQKVKEDMAGDFSADDEQRLAKAFDSHVGKPDQKFDENGWVEILESEVISDEISPTPASRADETPSVPSDKSVDEPKTAESSESSTTKVISSDDNPAAQSKENPQPTESVGAAPNVDGAKDAKPIDAQDDEKSSEAKGDSK